MEDYSGQKYLDLDDFQGLLAMDAHQWAEAEHEFGAIKNISRENYGIQRRVIGYDTFLIGEADMLFMQGKTESALAIYEQMLDEPTGDMGIGAHMWALKYDHIGVAKEALNDVPGAVPAFEEFLSRWNSANPTLPEIVDAKQRLASLTSQRPS